LSLVDLLGLPIWQEDDLIRVNEVLVGYRLQDAWVSACDFRLLLGGSLLLGLLSLLLGLLSLLRSLFLTLRLHLRIHLFKLGLGLALVHGLLSLHERRLLPSSSLGRCWLLLLGGRLLLLLSLSLLLVEQILQILDFSLLQHERLLLPSSLL
jgi:hypothetical protein